MRPRWANLATMLFTFAVVAGCQDEVPDDRPKAKDAVRVEAAEWEPVDGRNIHEFTLVNGNELAVKGIVVRFHYLDAMGKELGTAEQTFPAIIHAHDAIRKMQIDAGPSFSGTAKVEYEVVKVRTTVGGQRR